MNNKEQSMATILSVQEFNEQVLEIAVNAVDEANPGATPEEKAQRLATLLNFASDYQLYFG